MATQLGQVSGAGDKPVANPTHVIAGTGVTTKFGTFHVPPINRLASMNQGNPLAPLVQSSNRAAMFPHVQTPIGAAGQSRALAIKTPIYPSTNPLH